MLSKHVDSNSDGHVIVYGTIDINSVGLIGAHETEAPISEPVWV